MRQVVMHAPGDVRVEDREDPHDHRAHRRDHPADARPASAGPTCGPTAAPSPSTTMLMGHEYVGVVEEVGDEVSTVKRRRLRRRLLLSPPTTPARSAGPATSPTACTRVLDGHHRHPGRAGAHPARRRHPRRHPGQPDADLIPSLLAASDVLGTGWFAAVAAEAGPGKTVAVVGDGAVGLLGILAAKQLGAERIIAMSAATPTGRRWPASSAPPTSSRSAARRASRRSRSSPAGSARTRSIEAVGTQESMMQAIRSTRPGGHVGYVGVSHDVAIPGDELFFSGVHLHGGPAPVRRFLPELIQLIWDRKIDPGKVFDLTLPLERGRRGLPGHGRAPRHQGAPAAMTVTALARPTATAAGASPCRRRLGACGVGRSRGPTRGRPRPRPPARRAPRGTRHLATGPTAPTPPSPETRTR